MTTRFGRKRMAALAGAIGLVTGLTRAARASDFCISFIEGGINVAEIVGKGFRVPGPGRCKPFMGIKPFGDYVLGDVTGSACTSSDNSKVSFVLVVSSRSSVANAFAHITLPLPLGPVGTINVEYNNGADDGASAPKGFPCVGNAVIP